MNDIKFKIITKFIEKFHCSKRICTVAVSYKFEVFREFFQSFESLSHCKDTRTNTTVIGYLISKYGAGCSIHDEPDVTFNTTDFDVCFVSSKHTAFIVVVVIYEWFDTDGGSFTVVGYLLVGDIDVI